jgi:hypothetical protein
MLQRLSGSGRSTGTHSPWSASWPWCCSAPPASPEVSTGASEEDPRRHRVAESSRTGPRRTRAVRLTVREVCRLASLLAVATHLRLVDPQWTKVH